MLKCGDLLDVKDNWIYNPSKFGHEVSSRFIQNTGCANSWCSHLNLQSILATETRQRVKPNSSHHYDLSRHFI